MAGEEQRGLDDPAAADQTAGQGAVEEAGDEAVFGVVAHDPDGLLDRGLQAHADEGELAPGLPILPVLGWRILRPQREADRLSRLQLARLVDFGERLDRVVGFGAGDAGLDQEAHQGIAPADFDGPGERGRHHFGIQGLQGGWTQDGKRKLLPKTLNP